MLACTFIKQVYNITHAKYVQKHTRGMDADVKKKGSCIHIHMYVCKYIKTVVQRKDWGDLYHAVIAPVFIAIT